MKKLYIFIFLIIPKFDKLKPSVHTNNAALYHQVQEKLYAITYTKM